MIKKVATSNFIRCLSAEVTYDNPLLKYSNIKNHGLLSMFIELLDNNLKSIVLIQTVYLVLNCHFGVVSYNP